MSDADLAQRGVADRVKRHDRDRRVPDPAGRRGAPEVVPTADALWARRTSVTTSSGRVQRVAGASRRRAPRWTIGASRVSSPCDSAPTSDLATVDEVTDELARVAPALEGVDCSTAARSARRRGLPPERARRRDRFAQRGLSILADDALRHVVDPIRSKRSAGNVEDSSVRHWRRSR